MLQGHILLAEDNLVNQEVALGMLERLGCTADTVATGKDAAAAVAHTPYELILMDCEMPDMDGFAATRSIRSYEGTQTRQRLPIIALTAHTIQSIFDQCRQAGMDDCLTKPFRLEQLQEILVRWLPKHPVSAPLCSPAVSVLNTTAAGAGTTDNAPVLDPQALNHLRAMQRQGRPSLLHKIGQLYLVHTPQKLADLRDALNHKDAYRVEFAAHSLKSSSANVGAMTLTALCQELELLGKNDTLSEASAVFSQIEAIYPAVVVALQTELDQ
jgi:CheY-like chemotaxis protein/HPt (histidine-containing phosphotransfer) domain-containing protein